MAALVARRWVATVSNRQRFRQLQVPPSLRARLDAEGLGRARPRARAAAARPREGGGAAEDAIAARAFQRRFRFEAAATQLPSVPPASVPEVAVAGTWAWG
jgi:hypothetical protein